MLLKADTGGSGKKFTGKRRKCACRSSARPARREPNKKAKGYIDHMLFADLTSPSLARVLGHISGEHDVF